MRELERLRALMAVGPWTATEDDREEVARALHAWDDAVFPGYDMTEAVERARAALSGESHMMRWALLDIVAAIEARGKE